MSMYKLVISCNTTNNIHITGRGGGRRKNYSKSVKNKIIIGGFYEN